MGNVDSKLLPEGPEPGCVFYRPAHPHPVLYSNRNLYGSCTPIILDRFQRPINPQRPVENHSDAWSASAEASTERNRSRYGNESVEPPCPPYTCDAGHIWCALHAGCHPLPPFRSRELRRQHRQAEQQRVDAQHANLEAGAENHSHRSGGGNEGVHAPSTYSSQRPTAGDDDHSDRSGNGSESVYAPSTHSSQRSTGHRSSMGNAYRAGGDQVLPINDSMSIYYSDPGRGKGLIRQQGHHSQSERAGSTHSGLSTRSSGHNTSSSRSRQASIPDEKQANSRSGSSSASASLSRSSRSTTPRDQVAEPYMASGSGPQRHHRVDIFGDEHSTDDEGSSDGESDGNVGPVGGSHEAEQTLSSGRRVQYAIPEAEYQYFDTDSNPSSTMADDDMSERDRQPW